MQISHIVTVGCSWTYCQGLSDPKTQGWPALLAKKFNVPIVNLALPGLGNDAIHRRTYEYFFEDLKYNNNPLYIVAWSQFWRREAWCSQYYTKVFKNSYSIIAFPGETPTNPYEEALLDNWSDEDFVRKTNLYRLSLIALFNAFQTPYIESFFTDPINKSEVDKKFPNSTKILNEKTFKARNFHEVVEKYPKLPCGHESVESMPILADYIYKFLIEKYGNNFLSIKKPHLSLKDYNKIDEGISSVWE